jgi:ligand-binding SRPBCC domain-containing protein
VTRLELITHIRAPRERCFDLSRSVELHTRSTAERPAFFRDSMVRGVFARLDHEHHFADDGRGGTIMRDVFEFAAPCGVLGLVAERLVLTRYLRRFLTARNRAIKAAAESDAWKDFVGGKR